MPSIVPFKIAIPDEKLERLKQKLALSDIPSNLDDCEPWLHGPPTSEISRLTQYWASKYDWRKAEARLNEILPQFSAKVDVDGFGTYDVHFVHHKSAREKAIPLLFVHGWPGSFIEVTKILPELVKDTAGGPAFHVVAPSLIDFGFSSPSGKKGFNIAQHAEACHKVMSALGYDQYVVQGGDLGCMTARFLCFAYPNAVKAHLINNALPTEPTEDAYPQLCARIKASSLSPKELAGLARTGNFFKEENGYLRQQATRPLTLGYSLQDSPVGLLAWIYEKLHLWADGYAWTDDEILTWISIYYFSIAGPAASSYIYWSMEHCDPPVFAAAANWSDVPLGISRFNEDTLLLPKLWNHTLGPVVFEAEHDKGGHFAAYERPDAIVQDLRTMFGKGGGAYGVVQGKDGY